MNTPDCDASQQALREASAAWAMLKYSEGEIVRLDRYTALSRAMKEDRRKHIVDAVAARATLDRILKVRA